MRQVEGSPRLDGQPLPTTSGRDHARAGADRAPYSSHVKRITLRRVHALERLHSKVFALDGLLDRLTRDKPTHDRQAGPIGGVLGASIPEVSIDTTQLPAWPNNRISSGWGSVGYDVLFGQFRRASGGILAQRA